jgi:hypothetical protein
MPRRPGLVAVRELDPARQRPPASRWADRERRRALDGAQREVRADVRDVGQGQQSVDQQALVVVEVGDDDLEQEVGGPGDQVGGDHLRPAPPGAPSRAGVSPSGVVALASRINASATKALPSRHQDGLARQPPAPPRRLRTRPAVTAGFVWAAHARLLLRRLTSPTRPNPLGQQSRQPLYTVGDSRNGSRLGPAGFNLSRRLRTVRTVRTVRSGRRRVVYPRAARRPSRPT